MPMPKLINWDIIRSPLNWFIVVLMIVIAGFAADVAVTWHENAKANS